MADFYTYSGPGLAGLLTGISYGNKIWLFLTPLMLFTAILSIYKVVIDSKKDWKKGFFHALMLALGFVLWEVSTNYQIASINLTGWLDKAIHGTKEIPAPPDGEVVATVNSKSVFFPLTFSEGLALEVVKAMFTENSVYQQKYLLLLDDPRYIFALGLARFLPKLNHLDDEEKALAIASLAYYTGALDLLKEDTKDFPYGKEVAEAIENKILKGNSLLGESEWKANLNYLKDYLESVKEVIEELPDGEPYNTYKKGLINLVNKLYLDLTATKPYSNIHLAKLPAVADGIAMGLYQISMNYVKNSGENVADFINALDRNLFGQLVSQMASNMKEFWANVALDKEFNLKLMFTIQKFAYIIMFILFPFVVILSFMPIGGYNWKLLGSTLLGYFLLKLWVPLLVFAHYILLYRGIQDLTVFITSLLSSPIIGTAYAEDFGGVSQSIANILLAFKALKDTGELNSAVLNTLTVLIPSVLGTGTIVFIGRYTIQGIRMSIIEGAQAFQALKDMALTGLSVAVGGAKGFVEGFKMAGMGGVQTLDTTQTLSQTERIVQVANRPARLLKTEGSFSLVEFLDNRHQQWVPNSAVEPWVKQGSSNIQSKPPIRDRLISGFKGGVKGAWQGFQRIPKPRKIMIPYD